MGARCAVRCFGFSARLDQRSAEAMARVPPALPAGAHAAFCHPRVRSRVCLGCGRLRGQRLAQHGEMRRRAGHAEIRFADLEQLGIGLVAMRQLGVTEGHQAVGSNRHLGALAHHGHRRHRADPA